MRFLVDQNLSSLVADGLVGAGHDAVHAESLGLARAEDPVIFRRAVEEDRVIVSADTDFGDLLVMQGALKPSVVLIRRAGDRRAGQVLALLLANLPAFETDLEVGAIVVLNRDRVRIRRLPIV